MFTAKEIMSKPAVSIKENQTVKEALDILAEHKISGLVVVDDESKVIGIISDTDIIRYSQQRSVIPQTNFSFWTSPYTEMDDIASIREGFEMLHRTLISQVMTKKVHTVKKDTPATDVAKLMNRRNINRVPVIDDDEKLVGIITRSDVVQCLANL